MSSFRICVYAIAKNEAEFAARWAESMSEADEIIVLDTGSSDSTAEILSAFPKIKVYQDTVSPWRFDTARNKSLSLVPEDTDYCVSTDLDEVFEKGWRSRLENALASYPDKVSYRYVWETDENGNEKTVFNIEKIHKRTGFIWTHPVHEVLSYTGEGTPKTVFAKGVKLLHYPDRSKSRGQYLPLLEMSVRESPEDDRNMHYLGREYMFYGRYNEAIATLKKHLSLKSALWKDERSASMRYIANCCSRLGDTENAFLWLINACSEAHYLREPWMAAAEHLYKEKNWHGVIFFIEKALKITDRKETYITDISCYKEKPYDLLSIAYYYAGDIKNAVKNAERALEFSPGDERISNNLTLFRKQLNS